MKAPALLAMAAACGLSGSPPSVADTRALPETMLADAAEAHRRLEAGHLLGKIVLRVH